MTLFQYPQKFAPLAPISAYYESVLADGPSSYWRLGEPSGLAIDSVGPFPGTVNGTVLRNQPGALTDGNGSVTLDGTTGWVSAVPNTGYNFAGAAPYTLEAWINISALPATLFSRIIAKGANDGIGKQGWNLFVNPTADPAAGQIGADRWQAGVSVTATSGTLITLGVWNYVVATFDGTVLRVYLNAIGGTAVASPQVVLASSAVVGLGRRGDSASSFLAGGLDEVVIYPYALSQAQISHRFGLGIAVDLFAQGWHPVYPDQVPHRRSILAPSTFPVPLPASLTEVRDSQIPVEVLFAYTAPLTRVSQDAIEILTQYGPTIRRVRVSQVAVEVIYPFGCYAFRPPLPAACSVDLEPTANSAPCADDAPLFP